MSGDGRSHEPVVSLIGVLDELDRIIERAGGRSLSLAEIEDSLQGRGTGVIVLVLSLPFIVPVPIPLLATACGLPMVVMGLRIAITMAAHLPAFARSRTLSPEAIQGVAKGLRRILRPVAVLFRPRLAFMFWEAPFRLTGVSMALAAGVLSLPIPIPFANMIPALALIHLAAGLLQRDGVAVCVGHAFTLGTFVYLYLIWDTVAEVIRHFAG